MDLIYGKYRLWNNITGWALFVLSSIVYLLTLEPTVSFWDCGEFILSAFKLQVGHPPGAPLFVMMGRVATLFAGSDTSKVALMVNILSAICSGFAIMFLFWTITHLVRKIFSSGNSLESKNIPAILASGVIGALAYTFSDTFWFSAVEGELYAISSLVTGLVFWAMLKWEDEADKPYSGRWIILIAYIMGLGIGIHRLNLLVLPALVFVYYFRMYEVTAKGIIKTLLLSVVLLWIMVFVIMPGIPKAAGWFELLFVNGLGLPYNSGLFFYLILIIAGLVFGIRLSLKKQRIILNYILTSLTVIIVGYSSYAMIMIRSSASPPMNQNDPSNVFSFVYYINMEQYGTAPKLYGNYYSSPVIDVKQVVSGYNQVNGKYEPYYRPEYKYSKQFETIFPRMYSADPDHESAYKYWGKVSGRKFAVDSPSGKKTIVCPTFGENLRYFFRYQVGFMYLRYFMWNFAGRQNDFQGNGNTIQGNWLSGIEFIDEARLGNLDKIPGDLKSNPARNTYYFLPLLIGLAGMYWQYKKNKNGFWLVFAFFFMTGMAIILFLNQYPNQPRERDYAYAGSFYAFAIWIGMGFMLVHELMKKHLGDKLSLGITFVLLFFTVPFLMATKNWDDHDRSNRYTARDIGQNYLISVAPNAVLFTYGDNDSFPLWYVQDVEGFRTDVRVSNLSYIQAGWYIKMMKQKAYESDPLPISLSADKYIEGKRNQLPVENRVDKPVPLREVVEFAGIDDRKAQVDVSGRGDYLNYLPVNKFLIDVDPATVLSNGTVKEYFKDSLLAPMTWVYSENDAFKGDLAIMDLLSNNNWKRPVYFSTTVPSSQYKGLEKFFVQEGLAYRVAPVRTGKAEPGEFGMIDPVVMYDNLMNKFTWGNASDPSVYLEENNRRMFSNFRRLFGNLGETLFAKGDTVKAVEVAHRGLEIIPVEKLPNDFFSLGLAEILISCGHKAEGEKLINEIISYSSDYLSFAIALKPERRFGLDYPIGINMQCLIDIYRMGIRLKLDDLVKKVEPELNKFYSALYSGTN
ncbi:MAG: hypothetical protein C0408_02435 [Odoribacter sp.]|nr:hypothetical protein [Odoribacter sp.]